MDYMNFAGFSRGRKGEDARATVVVHEQWRYFFSSLEECLNVGAETPKSTVHTSCIDYFFFLIFYLARIKMRYQAMLIEGAREKENNDTLV